MKKILFLCSNMGIGGFQKSLISLLQSFDYNKYDVSLLLLDPSGVFMDLIPERVKILSPVIDPEYFSSGKNAIKAMLKKRKYKEALTRFVSCLFWVFDKGVGAVYMIKCVPGLNDEYDAIIDYNGQHLLYYMIDKLKAKKYITYFHSDYKKWRYYEKTDRKYYKKADAIITVSEACVKSMQEIFPEFADKIYCIENIISEKTVNLFPKNSNSFTDEFDGIRLVTVGRVCKDKGLDLACDALKRLIDNGYHVRWYMVGPITEQDFCQKCLMEYDCMEQMIFLGATNNPYDYMRNADIIVHTARYEGKAVAVEEAKILHKPIVATNFSTVNDQIIQGETGLIVEMNGIAVFEGIKRIINESFFREHIIKKQSDICVGNENEVDKLYEIIEK